MAKQKIVLKVCINCKKCKTVVLQAITKLKGIDQVTVDAEKWTVTVVGEVDPVCLTEAVRKTKKFATIVSVGPPGKPPEPAKPETPGLPYYCKCCQVVTVNYDSYDDGPGPCAIM